MDETQPTSTQEQSSNLNPLLIVVILIIIAAVGVMLWLGNNKNATQSAQVAPTAAMEKEEPTGSEGAMMKEETTENDAVVAKAISVEGGNFYFKPNTITVKKGEKVTITLTAKDMMHNFMIDELNVKSETINNGETTTFSFTPDKAGTFEFYCGVGQHRKLGMKGTLIVQ